MSGQGKLGTTSQDHGFIFQLRLLTDLSVFHCASVTPTLFLFSLRKSVKREFGVIRKKERDGRGHGAAKGEEYNKKEGKI